MQQKNSPTDFIEGVQETFQNMMTGLPSYGAGIQTLFETQRKNFQAITEVNQRAMQGWQSLAQRQSEMVSQFLQDNSTLTSQSLTDTTPEQKIAQQAEIMKNVYQRSIANVQELAELVGKCTKDTSDVINQRVVASVNEIKSASSKTE